MYTKQERQKLLEKIEEFMVEDPGIEGLVRIGSCAQDFKDLYSDIDLMAGCYAGTVLEIVKQRLTGFFTESGAFYIDSREWGSVALGLSAYWENGLSVDLSFMHTEQMVIRSARHKLSFRKTVHFSKVYTQKCLDFDSTPSQPVENNDHAFVYCLRKAEIAICRGEWIYADMMLGEARQLILRIQAAKEGRNIHQFKAWNSLEKVFLERLEDTYPMVRNREELTRAKECILAIYKATVANFDVIQEKLLSCCDDK